MPLKIEKMISGAYGLSHDDEGRAILVKSALEGEVVEAKKIIRRANTYIVEDYDLLEKSNMRIDSPCPYSSLCGGCDFLAVSEKDSAMLKEKMVKENLIRLTKLKELPPFEDAEYAAFPSYRSRCRFHVSYKTKEIGFLKRGSNDLIPLAKCMALTERLNDLLRDKSLILKEAQKLRIYNGINKNTGLVEVNALDGDDAVSIGGSVIKSMGYYVSSDCFFQSNLRLLPSLLSFVKENALGDVVLDLYSGVGTFSALFENSAKKVYSVEKNPKCLALSKKNAPSAFSFTSDATLFSKKIKEKIDTVILDPPRIGLDRPLIDIINSWKAERIIYVSCDSTRSARDLALFKNYKIEKAKLFDFYPGSFHEECAFVLSYDA